MIGLSAVSGAAVSAIQWAIPGAVPIPIKPSTPALCDLIAAFDELLPGMIFSRAETGAERAADGSAAQTGDWDSLYAAWAANGFAPLTQALALGYVQALHGPLPAALTSIRQLATIDDAPIWMNTP